MHQPTPDRAIVCGLALVVCGSSSRALSPKRMTTPWRRRAVVSGPQKQDGGSGEQRGRAEARGGRDAAPREPAPPASRGRG